LNSQDIIDELDPNKVKCCECDNYLPKSYFNIEPNAKYQICNSCYVFKGNITKMRKQGKDEEANFIQSLVDSMKNNKMVNCLDPNQLWCMYCESWEHKSRIHFIPAYNIYLCDKCKEIYDELVERNNSTLLLKMQLKIYDNEAKRNDDGTNINC